MKIRLWKLGDLDRGIIPNKKAIERLEATILALKDKDDEFKDIVCGPELNVYEFETVETIDATDLTKEEIQKIIDGGTQDIVSNINSHINNLVKEHVKKLLDNQK
jgi:hypothetical protein